MTGGRVPTAYGGDTSAPYGAVVLTALVLLAAPASAGPEGELSGPQLTPATQEQLGEGLQRLYALDYAKSRASFRKLIELEPDNPFGYLFEAGGIWWQSFQEYGLFKDTPTLQGLFEQDIEAALRKSEAYMDSKDRGLKADGYLISGMALGTRGQWSLMKGQWLNAYFDGKKAVKHLKKCVKLDAEYYDAYLGLGVADYQAAHFSGIAKLGFLLGLRGNEKRGLERMSLAMEKSRYANHQAAQFLSMIYLVDLHDDARALPLIVGLRKDFPDSPYFLFLEALLRYRLGDWDLSLLLGREFHRHVSADPKAFRRKWLTLVCGLSGSDCLSKKDMEQALTWLDYGLTATAREKPDVFSAHLRLLRAKTLDALGRREEAVRDYEASKFLPPIDDSREVARACLASACGREALLQRLRAMSKEE